MPSDSHQDQWSSQWHQWHSSNPMMCTRPMPIKSYLGPCGTCHSLRVKESNCTPHLHDWHANVQARMLTPMCPCSCPCPCPSSLHQVSWCLTAMCALQQKQQCIQCRHNIWCNTSKHLVGWIVPCAHACQSTFLSTWFSLLSILSQQGWTLAVPEQIEQINKHTQNTTNNNPNLRHCDVQNETKQTLDNVSSATPSSSLDWSIKEVHSSSSFCNDFTLASSSMFLCWSCAFVHFFCAALLPFDLVKGCP